MAQGQICYMRSSSGPDLSFETLKSEFDCITKEKKLILNFGNLWPKSREIAPLPGFLHNLQKTTINSSYLTLFRRFFIKELFEF